jgi:two-component system chemotaxis sensor kinase CheA
VSSELAGLVRIFVEEARQLCRSGARNVLLLEGGVAGAEAAAAVEDLARVLHNIKGTGATLGLEDVSVLAHALEDLVERTGRSSQRLAPSAADLVLKGLDQLLSRIEAHAAQRGADLPPVAEAVERLRAAADGSPPAAPGPPTEPMPAPGAPPALEPEPADDVGWSVAPAQVSALLREVERLRELRLRLVQRWRDDAGPQEGLRGQRLTAGQREVLATRAVGERADADEAESIITALEAEIREICTLPVAVALEPLHRAVRDVCRRTGKRARLSISGGGLAVDRRLVQALRAPLVHLVRNAVDHGIEAPEQRALLGKHPEGALTVRVELQGNMVFVEIADDGQGLDKELVRARAVERGVLDAARAQAASEEELHALIFRSGFTTRTDVTATSGRGVGLDLVRAEVQALRGSLDLESRQGQGTRFVLRVPSDVGSSAVLQVQCGQQVVGIPVLGIERVVPFRAAALRSTAGEVRVSLDDRVFLVRDLGELLRLRPARALAEGQPLVVVQTEGNRIALAVDEIVGDGELLIRPVPREVCPEPAWLGAAAVGSGHLLMVLRPEWLVRHGAAAGRTVAGERRVLVVDDSITARSIHRAILQSGGFDVHAVSSAREALQQLEHGGYHAVVCDLSMPEMDGLQLTRTLRQAPATQHLPVVVVSARDQPQDRELGQAAGADAFLSKRECASGRLLGVVTEVIGRRGGAG